MERWYGEYNNIDNDLKYYKQNNFYASINVQKYNDEIRKIFIKKISKKCIFH